MMNEIMGGGVFNFLFLKVKGVIGDETLLETRTKLDGDHGFGVNMFEKCVFVFDVIRKR